MTFALLLRFWKPIAVAALVLALVVAFGVWRRGIEDTGVAKERGRVADSTLAVIAPQLVRVETLYVHDTVRVTRTLARLDTVRETILDHLTDTIRVKEFVLRSDSVAAACADLLSDCREFRRLTGIKVAALESKLNTVAIAAPRSCTLQSIVVGAIGVGVGYLAHRR